MTPDDIRLKALSHEFALLNERRRELDAGADDASRPDGYARFLRCANEVLELRASNRTTLRVKCRVLRALIAATGATGPAVQAALSIAVDIERREGRPV